MWMFDDVCGLVAGEDYHWLWLTQQGPTPGPWEGRYDCVEGVKLATGAVKIQKQNGKN